MQISNIIKEDYLKKFRIHYPKSLLEPDFSMLQRNKCPICFHKLYPNLKKTIYRCKQKDKYFIKGQTLLALGGSLA